MGARRAISADASMKRCILQLQISPTPRHGFATIHTRPGCSTHPSRPRFESTSAPEPRLRTGRSVLVSNRHCCIDFENNRRQKCRSRPKPEVVQARPGTTLIPPGFRLNLVGPLAPDRRPPQPDIQILRRRINRKNRLLAAKGALWICAGPRPVFNHSTPIKTHRSARIKYRDRP